MNKKSGFTLAEVLVTLMIIGVIASMTIPSLMQSTAKQEFKTAYKKAISSLSQALTLNYALDGEDASSYTGTGVKELFYKRMNILQGDSSDFYTADGMRYYDFKAGNDCIYHGNIAQDNKSDNICVTLSVDVNGQKGPNKPTKGLDKVFDIFTVAVYPQSVMPGDEMQRKVLYDK